MNLENYHELMNSATVIKNMAELLSEDEGAPEKKDMLSTIVKRADNVADQLSKLREDSIE